MRRPTISRRTLLKSGIAGAVASPMLNLTTAFSQSESFNWKRFQGQNIEVSLTRTPRSETQKRHLAEFQSLTGIKVGLEEIPEQQHRQKIVIEFNSGKPNFDVASLSYSVQKRQLARGKWLANVEPMLGDRSLTPPDWDRADFSQRGLEYATDDGRLTSLPLSADYWLLYWNKDLFNAKGVAYPKSIADIVTAAAKLHDPTNGISGIVARGLRNANVPVWTQLLLGYGQETTTGTPPKLATTTEDSVAAATIYQTLLKASGPQGVSGFNWNEAQSLFAQGRAAMWIDGVGFAPPLEDAKRSRIVGKVGYGVFPPGPKAHHANVFGDGIGIAAASSKKEAAFLYCLWVTSKTMCNRLLQTGSGVPFRNSSLVDKETLAALTVPKDWADCVRGSAEIARTGLPNIVPVTEFRDTFGAALTNMIGGADLAAELKKATDEFGPVLDRSEQL